MGRFHKKRLFGNNYPVTCHFWLGYITKIASEHTPKTTVTIQNCHGYFTIIASKQRVKNLGYLPLLPNLEFFITKIATVTLPFLTRLLYNFCH